MSEQQRLEAVVAEYFEQVKPIADAHNPYTGWGMSLIQQGCKRVIDELAARYDITEEALLQAIRTRQQQV